MEGCLSGCSVGVAVGSTSVEEPSKSFVYGVAVGVAVGSTSVGEPSKSFLYDGGRGYGVIFEIALDDGALYDGVLIYPGGACLSNKPNGMRLSTTTKNSARAIIRPVQLFEKKILKNNRPMLLPVYADSKYNRVTTKTGHAGAQTPT